MKRHIEWLSVCARKLGVASDVKRQIKRLYACARDRVVQPSCQSNPNFREKGGGQKEIRFTPYISSYVFRVRSINLFMVFGRHVVGASFSTANRGRSRESGRCNTLTGNQDRQIQVTPHEAEGGEGGGSREIPRTCPPP